ncbi:MULTISPECIES: hypothetical protein [unclassified Pseudomonas]|nr:MULTISPECIES: hypothetical protein [unclassified Pseudomonas]MBD8600367.1 hypothetical protein [Pseudomonas sp. CFBP 8772]RZI71386.1 MAG: hypothetical protein EOP13_18265 [Pseudomonas sp.]
MAIPLKLAERPAGQRVQRRIISVDGHHQLAELLYQAGSGKIASTFTSPFTPEHPSMKRQLIALTLSLLASSAFAMPASEQAILGEAKATQHSGLPTLAQDGPDRLINQYQRVAENGPDRLIQQYQRVS